MLFLQLLANASARLNTLVLAIGAVWLLLRGDVLSVALGLGAIPLAMIVLPIVLTPREMVNAFAQNWQERENWLIGLPFALLAAGYSNAVIGAWCYLAVTLLIPAGSFAATLPVLLWVYGVVVAPLRSIIEKSVTSRESADIADVAMTLGVQCAYVAMAASVLVHGVAPDRLYAICFAVMSASTALQTLVYGITLKEAAYRPIRGQPGQV